MDQEQQKSVTVNADFDDVKAIENPGKSQVATPDHSTMNLTKSADSEPLKLD